ncbi:MAG: hypothetical protein GY832_00745, partial [Chloroflexi bacterium]|nr:hypothetical protein [Chloroflexota bacterium]
MAARSDQKQLFSTSKVPPFLYLRKWAWAKQRLSTRWAVAPLFILDTLSIMLSMFVAYQLRFRLMDYQSNLSSVFYVHLAWVAIPLWLLIFASYRLYHIDHLFGGMREYASAVNACTAGLVALVVYSFLNRYTEHDISRGWLALVWMLAIIIVVFNRFTYRHLVYRLREQGLFVRRALVVGANEEGRAVVAQLRAKPTAGVEVVGFVEPSLCQGMRV